MSGQGRYPFLSSWLTKWQQGRRAGAQYLRSTIQQGDSDSSEAAALGDWFFPASGGGVSASIAWTEDSDATSLSGSVISSGSVAWTEANDTASLSGAVIVSGLLAWTESDDVTSITGTFGNGVFASVGWAEADDTAAIAGSVLNPVTGAISWIEADDTVSLVGGVTTSGALSWTEDNDVTSIAGASFSSASAAIAWAEQDDVFAITGTAPDVTPSRIGGDDVPEREEYWEVRKPAKKRDETLEKIIQSAYKKATGYVEPEIIEEINPVIIYSVKSANAIDYELDDEESIILLLL